MRGARLRLASASVLCLIGLGRAQAELEVVANGREIVVTQMPPEQQQRYPLFKLRCGKCHSLKRPIAALVSGRTEVTGEAFEKAEIEAYVIKMMRKRGSRITKEEAVQLTAFLVFARQEAKKGAKP